MKLLIGKASKQNIKFEFIITQTYCHDFTERNESTTKRLNANLFNPKIRTYHTYDLLYIGTYGAETANISFTPLAFSGS